MERDNQVGKVNLLLVDDHPENLVALGAILANPLYNLVTARSGAEALKHLLKRDFAVLLLDVLMPDMDGFETARLIREREATRALPILFLTAALKDPRFVHRGYEVGAVDYLVKPLDPEVVRAKVAALVDLYRRTENIRLREARLREVERQVSADALRDSEALYATTFEQAAVGIAHMAPDGRWLRVNQRFCDIVGYSRAELLQRYFHDITHPDDVRDKVEALQQMVAGRREMVRRERRYLHRDGSTVWVNVRMTLMRDSQDRPRFFIKVIEDVSEEVQAREMQRFVASASEVLLSSLDHRATLAQVTRMVVPRFADLAWVDLGTDQADQTTCAVLVGDGNAERQALAHELRALLPAALGTDRAADTARHSRLIADLGALGSAEHRRLREVIELLRLRSLVTAPMVARERLLGTLAFAVAAPRVYGPAQLGLLEDLANRAALAVDNARLLQATQAAVSARDEFLSIASHELRTPLTSLQLHLQRLAGDRRRGTLLDHLPAALERCEKQVRRLTTLVDNLLDVSRIGIGKLSLQFELVDLGEVVRDVSNRFAEECAQAKCELRLHEAAPIYGLWDRLRLEQVFSNLLVNAVKYGEGSQIELGVGRIDDTARVWVRDRGIGIQRELLERIFQPFERGVSARAYGGLGLGLYIARQLVEAHGGRILVDSEPEVGSTFVVELPIRGVVPATAVPSQRPEEQHGSE